ncbi:MAG: hypothetical protein DRI44_08035, partial [Chlamydiae bacterium]
EINITLLKPPTKTNLLEIIFQKSYKQSVDCKINNTESLAKALSEGTKKISAEVIKDVVSNYKL